MSQTRPLCAWGSEEGSEEACRGGRQEEICRSLEAEGGHPSPTAVHQSQSCPHSKEADKDPHYSEDPDT